MAFAKIAAFFNKTAGRALNKATMLAATKGMAEMVYADGVVENDELLAAKKIMTENPKLKVFGGEAIAEFDKALDKWEESKRMARVETDRALADWVATASHEEKEDFLICILDLMDSDGDQDPAEVKVAEKYAALTGLNLKNYL